MHKLDLAPAFAFLWLCLPLKAQIAQTPDWLKWLGNGKNSYSCTSGTCNLTDELWFSSFTVSAGATVLNAGGNGPLIVRATGTCTIAGTIASSPVYGVQGITGYGDYGGGGGGGGGGTGVGAAGKTTQAILGIPIVNGGAGGTAGGGAGHTALSTTAGQYQTFLGAGSPWPGGGGQGGQGGSGGGLGGDGGMPVIFVCNTINFTGTIDVRGGNGGNAGKIDSGAGGGGGAGYVVLAAVSFTANSGTIRTTGGLGGTCNSYSGCGAGGNGGNGWSYSITIQ